MRGSSSPNVAVGAGRQGTHLVRQVPHVRSFIGEVGYAPSMRQLIGNSVRDGDVAWVRLRVARGRVVEAAGEGLGVSGLCRAVCGLSMLEAAAVPGEALAT